MNIDYYCITPKEVIKIAPYIPKRRNKEQLNIEICLNCPKSDCKKGYCELVGNRKR